MNVWKVKCLIDVTQELTIILLKSLTKMVLNCHSLLISHIITKYLAISYPSSTKRITKRDKGSLKDLEMTLLGKP